MIMIPLLIIGCGDKEPENQKPQVTLEQFEESLSFLQGNVIQIQANISDTETATDQLVFDWELDGVEVCSGNESNASGLITCDLSPEIGAHVLILEVYDQDGGVAGDSIEFEVVDGLPPEVDIINISSSLEDMYEDLPLVLEGTVTDDEDSLDSLSITWQSDIDGVLGNVTADTNGTIHTEIFLSAGLHQITLEATDSRDKVGIDVRSIEVRPANSAPSCSWQAPVSNSSVGVGGWVDLEMTVDDVDSNEDSLTVLWSSDIDGELGESTASSSGVVTFRTADLSPGNHQLSATVSDDFGLTCSDSASFLVGTPPSLNWHNPSEGTVFAEAETVEFLVTIADSDQLVNTLDISWTSSIDGVLSNSSADSNGEASFIVSNLSQGTHTIELTVVDEDGLSTNISRTIVINGLPSSPNLNSSPAEIYTADNVTITASGSIDPEGDPVTYSYVWYQNGTISTSSVSSVLPSSATAKGELWTIEVTPNDGSHSGTYSVESFVVLNSLPQISSASLLPLSPTKQETLQCTEAGESDADSDAITYSYSWYVNGTLSAETSDTLDGQNLSRGDSVYCQITPSDADDSGSSVLSNTVVIINSAPTISNISLSPTSPDADDEIHCMYDFTDIDQDTDSSLIEWEVNGVVMNTGNPLSASVVQGDGIECSVTANDGSLDGNTLQLSAVIANAPPVLQYVSITPTAPVFGDTLLCNLGGVTDSDGDSQFVYSYEWWVNGVQLSTAETLSGQFVGGDSVECRVTPSDGNYNGLTVSDSVTVDHTAPIIGSVSISPNNPSVDETIYCNYSYSDVDNGIDQSIITWSINSNGAGYANPLSAIVTRGDVVECIVEAYDGEDIGNSSTATVTISNDIPEINSIVLTPSVVQTETLVSPTISSTDADNDGVFYQYSWYVNGSYVTNSSQLHGTAFFDRGDTIYLEVVPSDGIDSGTLYTSSSVVVSNSEPTEPDVYVNYLSQSRVIDDLLCEVYADSSDADGDSLTYSYSWTVDGVAFTSPITTNHSDDTISAFDTVRGEEWECTVTVNDGNGGNTSGSDSVVIRPDLTQRIGAGSSHSCFLDAQGLIECWGPNISQVTQIPTGIFTELVTAGDTNCALKDDATIHCWGDNSFGQMNSPSGQFIQISLSSYHGCAVDIYQEIQCWGRDDYGETIPPSGMFIRVGAMNHLSCGIRDDDSMECWGSNDAGILTDPPSDTYLTPAFGSNAFDTYACAVSFLGVTCWGNDSYSQVVNAVNGDYERVVLGRNHICALSYSGEINCWGANFQGQTGSCSTSSQNVCTSNTSNYISVSAGGNHTCAITDTNLVECWGSDNSGQVSGWSGN
jgi:alpha-tubulin suppressor-like RCC1 family protein